MKRNSSLVDGDSIKHQRARIRVGWFRFFPLRIDQSVFCLADNIGKDLLDGERCEALDRARRSDFSKPL